MKLLSNIVIFSIQNTKIKIFVEKNYDTMYFFHIFSFIFPPGPGKSVVFGYFIYKKVLMG